MEEGKGLAHCHCRLAPVSFPWNAIELFRGHVTLQLNARAIEAGVQVSPSSYGTYFVLSLVVPSALDEIRMSPSSGFPRLSITKVIKHSS